ncbi:MAG: LacI family transcriptional regulator [Chloroflexota bacterium]|nr:LacI family transcriptional regulator [Chloroflexota bacterium]
MVTLKDVARRAGVSVITVSRVVNSSGYVRPETRARVEAAVEELQYVPNQMASNLRSRQTDTVALLLPSITNSFWTTIARGVEDEAWACGYGMFLCNTDDDLAKEERYVDILVRRRVEGVLLVPTPGSQPLLERLRRRRIKFGLLHRQLDGVEGDVIRGDNRGGAFALTEQLLAAGFRRIAYVGGPLTLMLARDRLAGYREAIAAAGGDVDPALVKSGKDYTQQIGERLVAELLRQTPRPEAVLIANSRLAIGALHAIAWAGLRVPADIAVAAFYDISALDDYSPLMVTAIQPAYEIGRIGARRLLRRGAENDGPVEVVLPNRITVPPGWPDGATAGPEADVRAGIVLASARGAPAPSDADRR